MTVELHEGKPPSRTSIVELLQDAIHAAPDSATSKGARAALNRLGIGVRSEGIDISDNHQELAKLYKDTPFGSGKWKDQLKRLPGARKLEGSLISGKTRRAVRLPFSIVPDALNT